MLKAMMNTAAEENTGRQRAASQSSSGKVKAIGMMLDQGSRGRKITSPLTRVNATTATTPSMSSLRGSGSRLSEASPIKNGDTVIIPRASDVNQWCQMVSSDALEE